MEYLNGSSIVCRFLPKDLAILVTQYLSYIRPLEILFSQTLYGTDATKDYNSYLFMKKGKRMNADDIRNSFKSEMLHYGLELTISGWRYCFFLY